MLAIKRPPAFSRVLPEADTYLHLRVVDTVLLVRLIERAHDLDNGDLDSSDLDGRKTPSPTPELLARMINERPVCTLTSISTRRVG
jgi:hypothetical protein